MSGVATLKPRKRAFDEMSVDIPGQVCSPSRFVIRTPPLKRGRCTPAASTTTPTPSLRVASSPSKQPTQIPQTTFPTPSSPQNHPSNSVPANQLFSADEIAALARHAPRRLRRVVEKMATGSITDKDKVFTAADLKEIITSVMQEREAKLSEEYAKDLHERLAQQFRDFTKFNEDYVSRRLRGTDFAYLS